MTRPGRPPALPARPRTLPSPPPAPPRYRAVSTGARRRPARLLLLRRAGQAGAGRPARPPARRRRAAVPAFRSRRRRRRQSGPSRSRGRAPSGERLENRLLGERDRILEPGGVLAAGARHRGPAAALAADQRGCFTNDAGGVDTAALERLVEVDQELGGAVVPQPDDHGRRRVLLLQLVRDVERIAALHVDHEHRHVAGRGLARDGEVGAAAVAADGPLRLLAQLRKLCPQLLTLPGALVQEREGLARGDRLDPARTRAHGALRGDHERPDLGRRADVCAAAELAREALDLDDANDVSVLLAEQHLRAEPPRLLDRGFEDAYRPADEDLLVDELLDPGALRWRERALVREVEPQLVRTDGRAGLLDVVSEHLPQRLVKQMRRRVVGHRREADAPRHGGADAVSGGEPGALEDEHLVVPEPDRLAQLRLRLRLLVLQQALIRDLAATLRVERRLAQLGEEEVFVDLLERADLRQHVHLLVADEFGAEAGGDGEVGRAGADPGRAGAGDLAVLGHEPLEAVLVDRDAALARELSRQLEREAVRGSEVEGVLAGDRAAGGDLIEELRPTRERLGEPLVLGAECAADPISVLDQLREPWAHLLADHVADPPEVVEPDRACLMDGAPHDPAEHVAATLIGGRDAVADEERHPAAVVGEDPVRLRRGVGVAVRHPALLRDPRHDRLVAVGLVDGAVRDVLDDRGETLEPHPRVDVLLRQRRQRAVAVLLVLHEDKVPELEEAVAAVARRRAGGVAAAVLRAPVPVDLRVGAARPWAAHRPEVLRARQRDDPLRRHPDRLPLADRDLVRPESEGGIPRMDGHPDPIPVKAEPFHDEFLRELNRTGLEVLPERKVAEHLEEREVVAVVADLVDVRRPEALLRRRRQRGRRPLTPEEIRHLRLHPGRRQQRRMVVLTRDQRPRGQARVALLLHEREKSLA